MLNGIRPEPTPKRFNSAYLQKKILICKKKFPVILFDNTKLFLADHKSQCCLRKKDLLKTKILQSNFQLGTPRQARRAKKQVALENSLRLHTRRGLAAPAEAV